MARPANGYVPDSALVQVEEGQYMKLEVATAAAYLRAKRENPRINIAKPAGAYRSYAVQAAMKSNPGAWNINPQFKGSLASPGYSEHGWGICVDIIGDNPWFLANMSRLGFNRPLGANDPNHYKFLSPTWAPVVLTETQRQVLPSLPVSRRIGAPSTSSPKGAELAPGTVGNFTGWIRGENVSGNDVWFQGISGDWFWSGGFVGGANTKGLKDLNVAVLQPNQRIVLGTLPCRRRIGEPKTTAPTGAELPAGSTATFDSHIVGELVEGNSHWYVAGNDYFWSGAFQGGFSSVGLVDKGTFGATTPTTPSNADRTVKALPARVRKTPTTASENIVGEKAGNSVVSLKGYVVGQDVSGNSNWGVLADGSGYISLTVFTDISTTGLSLITDPVPVDPGSIVKTDYKTFTKDSTLAEVKWVGSPNFGKYPAVKKIAIVEHWMAGYLAGTDATFQKITEPVTNGRSMGVATTYGVGQTEIHQYIKEDEYHHGNGNRESNANSISIEHEGGYTVNGVVQTPTKAVLDLSAKLHADIARRHGMGKLVLGTNVFLHSEFTQTTCPGTLNVLYILNEANRLNGYDVVIPEPEAPDNTKAKAIVAEIEVKIAELKANL